jgi:hypothetical protein
MFTFLVLNLPESIRTENKYMLQVCVAPGSKAPTDLFSFTAPIMKELETLQTRGFKLGNSDLLVKAHCIFVGGDIPGSKASHSFCKLEVIS